MTIKEYINNYGKDFLIKIRKQKIIQYDSTYDNYEIVGRVYDNLKPILIIERKDNGKYY